MFGQKKKNVLRRYGVSHLSGKGLLFGTTSESMRTLKFLDENRFCPIENVRYHVEALKALVPMAYMYRQEDLMTRDPLGGGPSDGFRTADDFVLSTLMALKEWKSLRSELASWDLDTPYNEISEHSGLQWPP